MYFSLRNLKPQHTSTLPPFFCVTLSLPDLMDRFAADPPSVSDAGGNAATKYFHGQLIR